MGLSQFNKRHFERVYQFWGDFPLAYEAQDWFTMLGSQWRIRKAVVHMLGDVDTKRILDLGCGTGSNFEELSLAVGPTGELVGADVHPAMLSAARIERSKTGLANIELVETSMIDLPFENGSFDGVFAMMSLSVVSDPVAALAEIARVTKPGGRFVVSDGRAFGASSYARLLNPLLEHVYAPLGAWFPRRDFTTIGPGWESLEQRGYVGGGFYAASFERLGE